MVSGSDATPEREKSKRTQGSFLFDSATMTEPTASTTTTTIVLRGEPFTVAVATLRDRAFWEREVQGWEDDTFAFVDEHVRAGTQFLDIGAWIGPVSLYAARKGARVIALEPDPVARGSLEANVRLNAADVTVVPAALHNDGHGLLLYGGPKGLGDSVTSALRARGGTRITVPTVDAATLILKLQPGPVVMKADVEGHEYVIAPELADLCRRLEAPLHLSLHPRQLLHQYRRNWVLWSSKRTFERTAALLRAFAGLPVRWSHGDGAVDARALAERFGAGYQNTRNFSLVING